MKRPVYEIRINRDDESVNIGFFSSINKTVKLLESLSEVKVDRKLFLTGLNIGYYKVTVNNTIYSVEKHYIH